MPWVYASRGKGDLFICQYCICSKRISVQNASVEDEGQKAVSRCLWYTGTVLMRDAADTFRLQYLVVPVVRSGVVGRFSLSVKAHGRLRVSI